MIRFAILFNLLAENEEKTKCKELKKKLKKFDKNKDENKYKKIKDDFEFFCLEKGTTKYI